MKCSDFRDFINSLEEREPGKLYDAKGRLRARFDEEENSIYKRY